MASFEDGNIVILPPPGVTPTLQDIPEGARVKLRFRPNEVARAFVRHANGDFTSWSLSWSDRAAGVLRLEYPLSANIRLQDRVPFSATKQPTTKPMPEPSPLAQDLAHRFAYHAPTGGKAEKHAAMREKCHQLALELKATVPAGRELSTAITKLEEVMMWANAGIARNAELQTPQSTPA